MTPVTPRPRLSSATGSLTDLELRTNEAILAATNERLRENQAAWVRAFLLALTLLVAIVGLFIAQR